MFDFYFTKYTYTVSTVYLILPLYSNAECIGVVSYGALWGAPDWASARAEALSYSAVKLFSKNSNLCVADT